MEKVISQPGKRPKKNKRVVGKKRIKIKIKLLGTQKFCTRNVVKSDEYGHKINMGRAKVKNNMQKRQLPIFIFVQRLHMKPN